jgi:hypothetical protein
MDPTAITVAMVFRTPQLVSSVSKLIGVVESVDAKLDKLLASDFDAGMRHLDELRVSVKEREFLLRQAWQRFGVAITHEEGERKLLAYLGLSFCQYHLGENDIALKTLSEMASYEWRDKKGRALGAARRAINLPIAAYTNPLQVMRYLDSFGTEREARIRRLKEQAKSFLNQEAGRQNAGLIITPGKT